MILLTFLKALSWCSYRETRQKAVTAVQRDDGDHGQDSNGDGEKCLDLNYVLEVKFTGFADG